MVRIHAGQPRKPRKLSGHVANRPGKFSTTSSPVYLPGVGLEIGNANVAEGDAPGEPDGAVVDVGDGETVGVGEGVGVGVGIIFSQ